MILFASRACLLALALAPSTSDAASLSISEVLFDATGIDDGAAFVELYGVPGAVLDGHILEGINGANGAATPILPLSGAIGADGFFVVADGFADGTTGIANPDLILNFDLQNGPDSVRLVAPDLSVLDALGYGIFGATDVFAGEGSPAPKGAPGQSLARLFANRDSNDNALDFGLLDLPTPGTGAILPEPGAASLLACGAVLLAVWRRASAPASGAL